MRRLHLLLLFVTTGALLVGLADIIAVMLGGATRDYLLATGFEALALGLGARHRGAGHVPLRASFVLLGLAGGLPLLAGFAPVSAAFLAFLFLPLRALGAQWRAALSLHPAGPSLWVIGLSFGFWLGAGLGLGLPGYLVTWLLAGSLLRSLRPGDAKADAPEALDWLDLGPNLLLGFALTLWVLFFLPYRALFDTSTVPLDSMRWLTLAVIFFLAWFTLGSGLAESRFRSWARLLCLLLLALAAAPLASRIADISQPDSFLLWLSKAGMRELAGTEDRFLPEQSWVFVPWLTMVTLGPAAVLLGLAGRTSIPKRDPGLRWFFPLLTGVGIALLTSGISASTTLLPQVGTMAVLVLAAAMLWRSLRQPAGAARWVAVTLSVAVGIWGARGVERPQVGYPLPDNFVWKPQLAGEVSAFSSGSPLQSLGWASVPQRQTRSSPSELAQLDASLLLDSRCFVSTAPNGFRSKPSELLMAAAAAPKLESVLMVGVPDAPSVHTLSRAANPTFTFACDPPQLVPLALEGSVLARGAAVQRSLATTDGPFDLVFLRGEGMWEGRRSVLRSESLLQASLRMTPGGICAFACGPEELLPGMLPTWIEEFRSVFDQVSVFVLAEHMSKARILILGCNPTVDRLFHWNTTSEALAEALRQHDLPLDSVADWSSLELPLPNSLPKNPWLFRAPMRSAEKRLAATAYRLIPELELERRAAAVLAEMADLQGEEVGGLAAFYSEQLGAQVYSVHDTYLARNPFATESSEQALQALLQLTRKFPSSQSLARVWKKLGVVLVEQREIGWMSEYFSILHQELGWQQKEVLLVLAHAALESLDFDEAESLTEEILAADPDFRPAQELRALAHEGETVPHDAHAGHDH